MSEQRREDGDRWGRIEAALETAACRSTRPKTRRYAVMVPLIETEEGISLLFEVRASQLKRQPGEICFPGGRSEAGESPAETARRETAEELLISPDQIHVLHEMEELCIYSGDLLRPVVGVLDAYEDTFSREEVDHVFAVPLSYLMAAEPESFTVETRSVPGSDFPYERIPGGREYPWGGRYREICFYRYGGYHIWGLTAGIVRQLTELLSAGGYHEDATE